MRKAFLFIFVIIFFTSCVSVQESEDGVDGEKGETYYEKGLVLLSQPHEDKFFSYINTIPSTSPQDRDLLLQQYMKNQEEMQNFFLEKGDIFKALHHFNNLYAVKEVSELDIDSFYKRIDKIAGEKGYHSFRKYLTLIMNWENREDDFSSLLPVPEYNFLLTEISIKREYRDKEGFVRSDYPTVIGSGIVLDSHHILTVYHLVEDLFLTNTHSYEIKITQGSRIFSNVEVLSWDSMLDCAILKITEELQYITDFYKLLGDSSIVKRGQSIYCLGHHAGYTSTMTKGIISAENRQAPEGGSLIQIDASVSVGAGGGLLIGEDGLIYGMIIGGIVHENINFAVPSLLIMNVLDQLLSGVDIKRPWLGIVLTTRRELFDKVYIGGIFPSSPLTETEIKVNDQLVSLNDMPVTSVGDAKEIVQTLKAGNCLKVRFRGDQGEMVRYVYLKRKPDHPIYSAVKNTGKLDSLYLQFGFSIDPGFKKQIQQAIKNKKYVINFYKVRAILKDSYLDKMGVKVGDLLGILSDFYIKRTRYIELFHIPTSQGTLKFDYIEDYIYQMKREENDENIL